MTANASPRSSLLESVLRRDRVLLLLCILGLWVGAWGFMVLTPLNGTILASLSLPFGGRWVLVSLAPLWLMWVVMLVGMMLPVAAPMVLVYDSMSYRMEGTSGLGTVLFLVGYFSTWVGFGLAAALFQWTLHNVLHASVLSGPVGYILGGTLILGPGLYQWTPLKATCVSVCRSPLEYLTEHWQSGSIGAYRMGVWHGVYCVGCCWLLMSLQFVVGVMNLYWMVVLAAFHVLEMVLPGGRRAGHAAGVVLTMGGSALILAGFF